MTEKKKRDERFLYVEAVSRTKRDVIRTGELSESGYKPFLVNRALSYHADAILYVSELNVYPSLDPQLQFDYYLHSLRPRNRFSGKWPKPSSTEDEEAVMLVMGYSRARAREAVRMLSDDQLVQLREKAGSLK